MNVHPNTPPNVREKFAFPVPSRPLHEQQNPPVPPQAVALEIDPVPLEVRRLRVANGSRRKRDLVAVRMAEELERLERMQLAPTTAGDNACSAFAQVAIKCWRAVPESTFAIWLSPLRCVGADDNTLFLAAPTGVRTWVERRYASLIREALQGTGYSDVEFVDLGEGVS